MIGRTNAGSGGALNKSTIIVTAPTGSTVTCKSGSITRTAPEKNGTWTFSGLDNGTWTITATLNDATTTETVTISKLTVVYLTMSYRVTPAFTYSGTYKIVDDNNNAIADFATWKGNWKVRFLTSGTFKITNMHGFTGGVNVFLVGGGGGGGASGTSGEGQTAKGGTGGPGYNKTVTVTPSVGTNYTITIGGGGRGGNGSVNGGAGGTTSAFGSSVNGGKGATNTYWGAPGTDGSGGTAAYEFNGSSGNRYSVKAGSATDNTGNSGAGGQYSSGNHHDGKAGRSGVVIIRNRRS